MDHSGVFSSTEGERLERQGGRPHIYCCVSDDLDMTYNTQVFS